MVSLVERSSSFTQLPFSVLSLFLHSIALNLLPAGQPLLLGQECRPLKSSESLWDGKPLLREVASAQPWSLSLSILKQGWLGGRKSVSFWKRLPVTEWDQRKQTFVYYLLCFWSEGGKAPSSLVQCQQTWCRSCSQLSKASKVTRTVCNCLLWQKRKAVQHADSLYCASPQ